MLSSNFTKIQWFLLIFFFFFPKNFLHKEIFESLYLSVSSGTLTQAIRNFAKSLEGWLTNAMSNFPQEIIRTKVKRVRSSFCSQLFVCLEPSCTLPAWCRWLWSVPLPRHWDVIPVWTTWPRQPAPSSRIPHRSTRCCLTSTGWTLPMFR